jgi:hypothetical protein
MPPGDDVGVEPCERLSFPLAVIDLDQPLVDLDGHTAGGSDR